MNEFNMLDVLNYVLNDEAVIKELYDALCAEPDRDEKISIVDYIDEVRYHGPAIIVFWNDGTKTVSVCNEMDDYDPEKGLAMCILKKLLGNSSYNEVFKQFIPDEMFEEDVSEEDNAVAEAYAVVDELLQTKKLTDRQRDAIKLLLEIE